MERRIKTAEEEVRQLYLFDYVVLNWRDQVDIAARDVESIINAEKCRVSPREINLSGL